MSLPAYLEHIQNLLDQAQEQFDAELDRFPAELKEKRPEADHWSVSEVCSHIAVLEHRLVGIFEEKAAEARREGWLLTGEPNWETRFTPPKGRVQAPEFVLPIDNISFEQALADLKKSRQEVIDLLPKLIGLDLGKILLAHRLFGELNAYQWLLLVPFHEQRHIQQLKRMQEMFGLK